MILSNQLRIYIPKSSTCLWFMIGFFFVYRYIFSAMDFKDVAGSINNDTALFMILLIMVSHPFVFNHPAIKEDKISVLHYLNIFMILKYLGDVILTAIYRKLVLLLKEINEFIDDI